MDNKRRVFGISIVAKYYDALSSYGVLMSWKPDVCVRDLYAVGLVVTKNVLCDRCHIAGCLLRVKKIKAKKQISFTGLLPSARKMEAEKIDIVFDTVFHVECVKGDTISIRACKEPMKNNRFLDDFIRIYYHMKQSKRAYGMAYVRYMEGDTVILEDCIVEKLRANKVTLLGKAFVGQRIEL